MKTDKIWELYHEPLLQFINRKVRNEQTSKDILQEVFIKVHLKKGELKDDDKISGWIYRIAKNSIIDHYRKKQFADLPEEIEQINSSDEVHLENCMKPFMKQLPEKYKNVIEETVLGSHSLKEYSKNINTSYSTIKSRFQRGKDLLKGLIIACCQPITDRYGNLISRKVEQCDCGCEI